MITLFGKPLSPQVTVGYWSMAWGATFILAAISYSIEYAPLRVVVSALDLMLAFLVTGSICLKKGNLEQISKKNMWRASYLTLAIVLFILVALGTIESFSQRVLSFNQILYGVAGFGGILQGVLFNCFERAE